MVRVIGIDIPNKKRLIISLTYLFGVGNTLASEIVEKLNLDPNMHAEKLTQDDVVRLASILQDDYMVEGDLRRQVQNNIKRLISIRSYRGMRHKSKLPCRGQRTQTNARTRKGRKKTVANKKKAV